MNNDAFIKKVMELKKMSDLMGNSSASESISISSEVGKIILDSVNMKVGSTSDQSR
jgi:hypothetical protein